MSVFKPCQHCHKEANIICQCNHSLFCESHFTEHRMSSPGRHPCEYILLPLSVEELSVLKEAGDISLSIKEQLEQRNKLVTYHYQQIKQAELACAATINKMFEDSWKLKVITTELTSKASIPLISDNEIVKQLALLKQENQITLQKVNQAFKSLKEQDLGMWSLSNTIQTQQTLLCSVAILSLIHI